MATNKTVEDGDTGLQQQQSELRKKIFEIQKRIDLDQSSKSKMIQDLMMRSHSKTPACCSVGQEASVSSVCSISREEEMATTWHDKEKNIMGCKHYQRQAKIKAPCCGKLFPCRFCHDEACDHKMDRFKVTEMCCMHCQTTQPIGSRCKSVVCAGRKVARYYCDKCRLMDDQPGKNIYHCPYCNICRIGKGLGIDFWHCHKCNACMSMAHLNNHKCVERSLESNCPICSEFMFDSPHPVMFLACGHSMHVSCFESYTCTNYTCPICAKSLVDMSAYFSQLDAYLETEQLPDEYADIRSNILCCDCEERSQVPFHFIYHKCGHCGSYNTKVCSYNKELPNEVTVPAAGMNADHIAA